MMHRAVARADREPVGGGDRRGDVGLGAAHRVGERLALWRGPPRSPTTACSRCRGCCAWRCAARRAASTASASTSRSTLSAPLPWPPLISTALAPSASSRSACVAHLALRPRRSARRAAPPLPAGSASCTQRPRNQQSRASSSIASGSSSRSPEVATITGSSTMLRLRYGGRARRPPPRSRRRCDSMPIFTAPTVEIGEHRVDLRGDEIRRHVVDAGDALGVLRGQRGDHRRAIDAERREGLQVGLDARAAAGIRTRDGDGDRGHLLARFASAASTTRSISRAAARGSGASDSAEITETPSAPASITGAALPALMPAMPQVGKSGLAPMQRLDDARHAGDADRRFFGRPSTSCRRRRRCRHSRSDRDRCASARCATVDRSAR